VVLFRVVFQEKTENSWYEGFMEVEMIYYGVKATADERVEEKNENP
jgi:hypothetical protein